MGSSSEALVDRIELVERGDLVVGPDRELPWLQPLGDVEKSGDLDGHRQNPLW
jgi:hypothetical protein